MAFLFIWQFILSGPLEIASGYIGFANYSRYVFPGLTREGAFVLAAVVGIANIALLYRRIESVGRLTVSLWIGTMVTTLAVVATGAMHFNPQSHSTRHPTRSTSPPASCSASAPRPVSASMTIWATTTSATSVTRSVTRDA